jgi:hypothetical protein
VASQVIAIFVDLDRSTARRLQRIFRSFRARDFYDRYPGFRKASTPTPPGRRRGHAISVYPLKSQSGAP